MQIKKDNSFNASKYTYLLGLIFTILVLFGLSYFLPPITPPTETEPTPTPQNASTTTLRKHLEITPSEITIEISDENYQRLAEKRKEALDKGILLTSSEDYLPAKLHYQDDTIEAKIRLKGDWSDHWSDEKKWSFRVEIEGSQTLLGMKSFSLQQPKTRGYLAEWIFHKILEDQGLIHLRYEFINVNLNNTKLGVYALEEHFEKRLIENNQRRESPIIKIDDYFLWLYRTEKPTTDFEETYSYEPIKAFNQNKALKEDLAQKQFQQATNLLELFRRRELKTHEVFDSPKMATLMAITDLMGHHHSTYFHNMRFYYNPITSLIEPIGYDNGMIIAIYKYSKMKGENQIVEPITPIKTRDTKYINTIFEDRITFEQYVQALEKISDKKWLDEFFLKHEDEINANLALIKKNYPQYDFQQDKDTLYKNQLLIKKILAPEESILAYYQGLDTKENKLKLAIGNIQRFPIDIVEIRYKKDIVFKPETPPFLNSKNLASPVDFTEIEIPLPKNYPWKEKNIEDLEVKFKIIGSETIQKANVLPWPYLEEDFLTRDLIRQTPNPEEFNFIQINQKNQTINIKSGTLTKNLILPKDHTVLIAPGTTLNLKDSAKILSYSPIQFLGTEDAPITIESSDKSGQGIIVMNAEKLSQISHTHFKGLSAPKEGNWSLVGAVTFYKSPVNIDHCHFENNLNSDDSLNIIHSEVNISFTLFENTFADAIDIDFGWGKISNSSFINCGIKDGNGDCLDFSGSYITLESLNIKNAGDKGISAGEKSTVYAKNIEIEKANIGIASKDASEININKSSISDTKFGIAAYQKKSEYGPSNIKATELTTNKVKTEYLNENGSTIALDEAPLPNNTPNALETIY